MPPPPPPPKKKQSINPFQQEQYVNNPTLSDVTFVVEGRTFHAHRIALLASSDTFRAMFDGHYREKDASEIPIPNISFPVFEAMMRCVYTGSVEVEPALAQDLLRAADQYMVRVVFFFFESFFSSRGETEKKNSPFFQNLSNKKTQNSSRASSASARPPSPAPSPSRASAPPTSSPRPSRPRSSGAAACSSPWRSTTPSRPRSSRPGFAR